MWKCKVNQTENDIKNKTVLHITDQLVLNLLWLTISNKQYVFSGTLFARVSSSSCSPPPSFSFYLSLHIQLPFQILSHCHQALL